MELNKEQVRELFPGITIRKKYAVVDNQESYLFYLNVQDLKIIDFECDFTGSQKITLKNRSEDQFIVMRTVQPQDESLVAQVELHPGWKLQTTFR